MTSSTSRSSISTATPLILPTITTLLGLTGLGSGSYALASPLDAIRSFGLCPPPPSTTTKANSHSSHAEAFQQSVIKAHGLRNVSGALAIIGFVGMWKFSPVARMNVVAADTARKCLGIYLMVGTVTAVGDAWIVRTFAKTEGLKDSVKEEAKATSMGHAVVSLPILATGAALFFL